MDAQSLYDPIDPLYQQPKTQRKGRRFCICAAIKGEGKQSEPGLVSESVWIFIPQLKSARKVDYHKNFNAFNFIEWFQNSLLPSLEEPSIIIMGNASYHKTNPVGTPNPSRMKKNEVLSYLTEYGIEYSEDITSIEARILLRDYISHNIQLAVVKATNSSRHEVGFTPPHYSDLQPIELL